MSEARIINCEFLACRVSNHCLMAGIVVSEMSLPGRPVSILTINQDESFTLDEEALKTVLTENNIKNKPVCIIPVAGQFLLPELFKVDLFFEQELSGKENHFYSTSWSGTSKPEEPRTGWRKQRQRSWKVSTGVEEARETLQVS